tara:strand:- start:246 stop:548 length:303 start_codon:yes stop_codon:yes gene_type:complete
MGTQATSLSSSSSSPLLGFLILMGPLQLRRGNEEAAATPSVGSKRDGPLPRADGRNLASACTCDTLSAPHQLQLPPLPLPMVREVRKLERTLSLSFAHPS